MNDELAPAPSDNLDHVTSALAALAHPSRLAILRAVSARGACCCKDVVAELPLAQSTVSQHLKVLHDAGLVRFERDATRSRYSVNLDALRAVSQALGEIVDLCCSCCERSRKDD